jgi:hypothetical protein
MQLKSKVIIGDITRICMDRKLYNENRPILKKNLWKFFKSLRVQVNPVYCLLVSSPINYAWIDIFNKIDSNKQKRVSISQFIHSLKKMPSTDTCYQLRINLYPFISDYINPKDIKQDEASYYKATYQHELSVEIVENLLTKIIAYHCLEAIKRGERLELTSATIQHYKFKTKYIIKLQEIIELCNKIIIQKETFNY